MTLVGTKIRERTAPLVRTSPTDTGVLFVQGLAERGPLDRPMLVRNMDDFKRVYGNRVSTSSLWDYLDTYFNEGGSEAYVIRVAGPAAAKASKNLSDGSGTTLTAEALTEGAWGNSLTVQVAAGSVGGTFVLIIAHTTLGELERSPDLTDQASAVLWGRNSEWVRIKAGAGSGNPVVAAASALTAGSDDASGVNDASWESALLKFTKDLGPGQVAAADRYTSTAHGQLRAHAALNNRVALLDPPDASTKATLLTLASGAKTSPDARYGALFAPWVTIPGLTATTTRSIAPSAVVAGLIARNDVSHSPNEPAGGDLGQARYALDVKLAVIDDYRSELNSSGVNMLIVKNGGVRVYGYRSQVDPIANPNWWMFGNSRLYMAIAARADAILERYVLRQIDGKRQIFGELEGELTGMLDPFYTSGSLYGEKPSEAFGVDTGPQVNTPESISQGYIKATIELTMSPMGEQVILEVVKKQIQG